MTLINLPKLNQTGTNEWADPEDNDKAIRDVVNGNLDNSNLASGAAIDPAKINFASGGGIVSSGKSIIATEETTTSTSYTTMTTPDQVTGIVLPTDGLIWISYRALVAEGLGGGRVAIFLGSDQVKTPFPASAPTVAETAITDGEYQWLYTTPAAEPLFGVTLPGLIYLGTGSGAASAGVSTGMTIGGAIAIEAAASTYTVSIRFKASATSTVYASERKLRVWSQSFG